MVRPGLPAGAALSVPRSLGSAALLDAGLSLDVLKDGIEKLNLPEKVEVRLSETHKGALRAAALEVIAPQSHQHRHLSDILGILSKSQLSTHVKQTAARIFTQP